MKRIGALVVALAGVSTMTGCAGAVPATGKATLTAAAVATPAPAPEAPVVAEAAPVLTRDADLKGDEHHVSLLEGKLTFKVHATETPKITTGSTSKGLLYSTLEAKLGDGQVVHCAAYADVIWPAGLVAADLRGEHDWANDGSEKADIESKTKAEVTSFDVVAINGTPTLTARAVVRDEASKVVAQRKIAVLSGTTTTFLCSDRTVGFSSRFGKFAGEAFASARLDPAPMKPTKVALYKIFGADNKPVGYRQVATYLDKGVTKTFSDEARLDVNASFVTGHDSLTTSVSNARGEETEIHYDGAFDGIPVAQSAVTRDKTGYKVTSLTSDQVKLKAVPLDVFGPAWTNRLRAVAKASGKKALTPTKVSLFAPDAAGSVVPGIMLRTGDGAVSMIGPRGESPIAFDGDGVVSMGVGGTTYKRVSVSSGQ